MEKSTIECLFLIQEFHSNQAKNWHLSNFSKSIFYVILDEKIGDIMTLNRVLLILWFSLSLMSPLLISTMRESDYSSMKGSKLVKLLTSQDLEIRDMAFYELQRRQCPNARESYAEFKENNKIFEVIVSPTGSDTPSVYLVLYDYDYWSSFPDQYYSIPDR